MAHHLTPGRWSSRQCLGKTIWRTRDAHYLLLGGIKVRFDMLTAIRVARLFIYWHSLRPNFISNIRFLHSFRGKKQKFRHSARSRYDSGLLRVATLQEHRVRAEFVISCGFVLSTKAGDAIAARFSKHFSLQQYNLFSVQPQQLTSAASTETTNNVIVFFFSIGWQVNGHFCPYLLL